MTVVELCRGTACDIAQYCHHYRHVPAQPGLAIKERFPISPGEHCPDYQVRYKPRWGDGPLEAND